MNGSARSRKGSERQHKDKERQGRTPAATAAAISLVHSSCGSTCPRAPKTRVDTCPAAATGSPTQHAGSCRNSQKAGMLIWGAQGAPLS